MPLSGRLITAADIADGIGARPEARP